MMNYTTIIQYVKEQTSNNNRPSKYPFRDRFEHTMRVYRWAIKLQSKLGGDIEIISLAALLHDIGWDENEEIPHGDIGSQMAADFLVEMDYDPRKIGRICEIIRQKYSGYLDDPDKVRRMKNALARRGYSFSDINEAVRMMECADYDEYE